MFRIWNDLDQSGDGGGGGSFFVVRNSWNVWWDFILWKCEWFNAHEVSKLDIDIYILTLRIKKKHVQL